MKKTWSVLTFIALTFLKVYEIISLGWFGIIIITCLVSLIED